MNRTLTAAQALLGKDFSVSRRRGELVESNLAPYVIATVHPSSVLRTLDDSSRHAQMRAFVEDMKKVAACFAANERLPECVARTRLSASRETSDTTGR